MIPMTSNKALPNILRHIKEIRKEDRKEELLTVLVDANTWHTLLQELTAMGYQLEGRAQRILISGTPVVPDPYQLEEIRIVKR